MPLHVRDFPDRNHALFKTEITRWTPPEILVCALNSQTSGGGVAQPVAGLKAVVGVSPAP